MQVVLSDTETVFLSCGKNHFELENDGRSLYLTRRYVNDFEASMAHRQDEGTGKLDELRKVDTVRIALD